MSSSGPFPQLPPIAHLPAMHRSGLQQSVSRVQLAPALPHAAGMAHLPLVQTSGLQQSPSLVQAAALRPQPPGFVHLPVADQITDIRHDPILAGLDEPILVKLRDVVLYDVHLLGDDLQQRAQGITLLGVALPIYHRQQFV